MNKNETIRNLGMSTPERQTLAWAPEKGSCEKNHGSRLARERGLLSAPWRTGISVWD
jgi:hypothetical protein